MRRVSKADDRAAHGLTRDEFGLPRRWRKPANPLRTQSIRKTPIVPSHIPRRAFSLRRRRRSGDFRGPSFHSAFRGKGLPCAQSVDFSPPSTQCRFASPRRTCLIRWRPWSSLTARPILPPHRSIRWRPWSSLIRRPRGLPTPIHESALARSESSG